jgi:hypothetical protein
MERSGTANKRFRYSKKLNQRRGTYFIKGRNYRIRQLIFHGASTVVRSSYKRRNVCAFQTLASKICVGCRRLWTGLGLVAAEDWGLELPVRMKGTPCGTRTKREGRMCGRC